MNNEDIRGLSSNVPFLHDEYYDEYYKEIYDKLSIPNEILNSTPAFESNIYKDLFEKQIKKEFERAATAALDVAESHIYEKLREVMKELNKYQKIHGKNYRSIEEPFEPSKTGE